MTVFFSASRLPREAIFTLARVNALSTLPERNEGLLVVYLGRFFFFSEKSSEEEFSRRALSSHVRYAQMIDEITEILSQASFTFPF